MWMCRIDLKQRKKNEKATGIVCIRFDSSLRFRLGLLYNQLDDDALEGLDTPSAGVPLGNYFGLLSLEGGICILPEDLLVFQDTSFQLEIFGGLNVIVGGDTFDITFYRYIHRFWEDISYPLDDRGAAARFIPYFGFGAKIGFDL